MSRSEGFSLIELLIVVAVIGIIAALAVPNLVQSRKAANEASAIASVRNLVTAQITYASTLGSGNFASLADWRQLEFPATTNGIPRFFRADPDHEGMVKDQQVRRLVKLKKNEKTLTMAAAKAGMSRKTARKYLKSGKLPSQCQPERGVYRSFCNLGKVS